MKILLHRTRDIKESESLVFSPTTIGLWQGMPPPWNKSDT